MGLTISQKIFEKAAGIKVTSGEYVSVKPDLILSYAGLTYFPVICKDKLGLTPGLKEVGVEKIAHPQKNVIFIDHLYPPHNATEAENIRRLKKCIKEQGIKQVYCNGIGHQVAAEKGFGLPGMLILHFDCHVSILGAFGAYATSVTLEDMLQVNVKGKTWLKVPKNIKVNIIGVLPEGIMARDVWHYVLREIGPDGAIDGVLEFSGSVIDKMSIDGRMTICSLAPFSGAETAIMNPDSKVEKYLQKRAFSSYELMKSDSDAEYDEVLEFDVTHLEPQIAVPPDVYYIKSISEVADTCIDQAIIGSCASGRLEDLRIAAKILKNKKVHPNVRLIVTPASNEVYEKAASEGILRILARSGAVITYPTCDTCFGSIGYLVDGERCISTSTLNVPGRMGSQKAEIYLASPAVVAASAVKGEITDPRLVI